MVSLMSEAKPFGEKEVFFRQCHNMTRGGLHILPSFGAVLQSDSCELRASAVSRKLTWLHMH